MGIAPDLIRGRGQQKIKKQGTRSVGVENKITISGAKPSSVRNASKCRRRCARKAPENCRQEHRIAGSIVRRGVIRLEELQPGAFIRGIVPNALITVVSVQWRGSEALELTYKAPTGQVANELLYRHDEPHLEVVEQGRPWSFDGDGALFRPVGEAQRIRLAHLFDPVRAVHTSIVEPLPHQITAVDDAMLLRQPLRFLLADDPGAGKTIMAGLLMRELIVRGDLQRCLVVCPGTG